MAEQVKEVPQIEKEPVLKPEPKVEVSIEDTIVKAQTVANQIYMKFPIDSDIPLNDEFDSKFQELAQILINNSSL